MEPVGLEIKKTSYILTHKCEKCGAERRNHTVESDNIDALTKLSETLAKKALF